MHAVCAFMLGLKFCIKIFMENICKFSCGNVCPCVIQLYAKLLINKVRALCHLVMTRLRSGVKEWVPLSDGYSIKDLQDMQENFVDIGSVIKWLSSGSKPGGNIAAAASRATRRYLTCWGALIFRETAFECGSSRRILSAFDYM